MRKLIIFLSIIFIASNLYSQHVKNVEQKIDNGRIVITYELDESVSKNEFFDTKITASNKGKNITPKIVFGDMSYIKHSGKKYKIWWEPQLEGRKLAGWFINLKVKLSGLVFVEGGTFHMGTNNRYNEKPVHKVTVDDFVIGKYEVTKAEWEKIMGDNLSHYKGDNRPVESVSWYDAVEFCNKKSEMDGLEKCYSGNGRSIKCDFSANGYRLPTEAEWEYAARGGNKSRGYNKYSGSYSIHRVAWCEYNSTGFLRSRDTHPVGQKQANELGIYDMSGNVDEWCSDWYDSDYYENSTQNNPTGPSSGSRRVSRGGNYYCNVDRCRVAYRSNDDPDHSFTSPGFRFVKSVE